MRSVPGYLLLMLLVFGNTACTPVRHYTVQEDPAVIVVEAEDYDQQDAASIRRWYRANQADRPTGMKDADPDHTTGAVGTYLEILPDTRQTHDDPLVHGENFSNEPGKIGILKYPILFAEPGRYYVWVRAYYTGTEDNGIHVGLDDTWPESGQRMQWCGQADSWHWESKQRTEAVHCGVERQIYLDVPTAGMHTVQFSMREDGFEFDRFLLSKDYQKPSDQGPQASKQLRRRKLPKHPK